MHLEELEPSAITNNLMDLAQPSGRAFVFRIEIWKEICYNGNDKK